MGTDKLSKNSEPHRSINTNPLGKRNVSIGRDATGSIIITGDGNEVSVIQPRLTTARLQLRAPVADFVGREKEIKALLNALQPAGKAAIAGIIGMGGVGKTELALAVADRLRDDYPDAQLFVSLRGTGPTPRNSADALTACLHALMGIEVKLPEDVEDLTQLYRSQLSGKRALIVLDNAADSAQIRPLLPPQGNALLITSRTSIALPGMTRIFLDQLHPDESRDLLINTAPHTMPDVADQICHLCGHLPLAVRAAGSLLAVMQDLDPADYAEQLRDERTRLEHIGSEEVETGVEASFNLSYVHLQQETARVFRQLAIFPASFDAAVEEFACDDTDHKHLSDLVRFSLAIYDAKAQNYRLHDLARVFAGARLSEKERETASRKHAIHFHAVIRGAMELYMHGQVAQAAFFLIEHYWTDIRAGQAWAESHTETDDSAAAMAVAYPLDGARILYFQQDSREHIKWLNAAAKAARRLNWPAAEGAALDNLGLAHYGAGQPSEAVGYYEKALSIVREIKDEAGEGATLGNLGLAYYGLGQPREAIECYEKALVIARRTNERRGEGITLGNLGAAYSALGEMERAIEFYDQAQTILQDVVDPHLANVLWLKALALDKTGERAQAIDYAEVALEIYEQFKNRRADDVRRSLDEWRDGRD